MDEQAKINSLAQLLWATASEQAKSALHAFAAGNYYNDFCKLQNILNGFLRVSSVEQTVIDNAKEYYKQFNKSLLIYRDLRSFEKTCEESKIDMEACRLKNDWMKTLNNRNISIVQKPYILYGKSY